MGGSLTFSRTSPLGTRCPAFGQQWGCYGKGFFIQVGEYLLDDHRIFNAGDDVHGRTNAASARMRKSGHFDATAAGTARFDVDIEHPLETLGLKLMAARRSPGIRSCACSGALGLLPLPRLAGVTCTRCLLLGANTPWKRMRLTLGLGTRAASQGHGFHASV